MRLWFIAVALCVSAVPFSAMQGQEGAGSAAPGHSGTPPAMHDHHGPMPKPVNLKVLPKDMSGEDVMKLMHGMAGQLGVQCGFCHVADAQTKRMNFASDEKPEKNVARTMISMTNEINAKYLSQVKDPDATPEQKMVTCGTCHRGHNMPAVFKAPPEPEHKH